MINKVKYTRGGCDIKGDKELSLGGTEGSGKKI